MHITIKTHTQWSDYKELINQLKIGFIFVCAKIKIVIITKASIDALMHQNYFADILYSCRENSMKTNKLEKTN